ncbi:uncharacterized protein LOC123309142 [Coccinella septempunctata]|uniref:uncharacterized protein LOC123309142 n=1 Tax=Coccinella septempunctata TaxID=41139 RepID=UPI001D06ABF6|nr:uncharacterized protein LOC123309142 [Coccinella septempunctata]
MDKYLKSTNNWNEDKLNDAIRKRIQFYKEENAKFETTFSHCKLLHESSSSSNWDLDWDMHKEIDRLGTVLEHFDITEFDATALAMAYIEQKSNDNNYIIEKLKNDTKLYIGLNDEILKDIERLSRDLKEAKEKIHSAFELSNDDIFVLEKKISAYENELAKFEKKHSWLKNPQLDLTHIAKEAQTLASMQEEREALEKELNIYQGLQPDLQEASHQLSVVKKQYQEMKDKFHSSV